MLFNCFIAETLWKHLDQLNQSLAQTLLHLSRLHDQDPANYKSAVKYISTLQPLQWEANPLQPPAEQPIVNTFYQAHRISQVSNNSPFIGMKSQSGLFLSFRRSVRK